MTANKAEPATLRGALGMLAMGLLVGGMLVGASYYFREEMATEYHNHQLRFRDVSRKYLAVDDEERIIENAYPEFVRLFQGGILGHELRLSWIEALRRADEAIGLPALDYRINSQTVYEPPFPVNLGAFDIRVSEMHLTVGLLHEGDLIKLLNALDTTADGLYSVSRCEGNRVNDFDLQDRTRPKIKADCVLEWFTVELKGGRELSL
ncbi:MAG: hypothetical protein ACU85U_12710 [Gammaproteobacteria bacterium]|jgi:hypothetical protein